MRITDLVIFFHLPKHLGIINLTFLGYLLRVALVG